MCSREGVGRGSERWVGQQIKAAKEWLCESVVWSVCSLPS